MTTRRYTLILADRETGAVRRMTVAWPWGGLILAAVLAVPAVPAIHAVWSTWRDGMQLRLENVRLEIENAGYRAAAADMTRSIASLSATIDDLAARTPLDAERMRRTAARLPTAFATALDLGVTTRPGPTFDRLGHLLDRLGGELHQVRRGVAQREALHDAIPTIWPADGWVSASYGYRRDPFTGQRDFHPAIDISTRPGQPVYATGRGVIAQAARHGAYGNLVEIDHGFGLVTRYGHLAAFAVAAGDTVARGDMIGHAGATGRATGHHVHYEVLMRGQTINPLRLITEPDTMAAN